jgi:enoyl-CoA hydratase/carnithine racemase
MIVNIVQNDEVLFSEIPGVEGDLGVITLNRPHVLNALNHTMVQVIYAQLQTWAVAPSIKAVIIRAVAGRAFCAGGDLRSVYQHYLQHQHNGAMQFAKDVTPFTVAAAAFFRDEYQLNSMIFNFPKPYIAFLDGITMGGGVGLSVHGSHRIATDNLLFAMPETSIGFFPDIGGTYFLPKLPQKIGFYLALSGAKLTVDDCLALGIVTQKVTSMALPDVMAALAAQSFGNNAQAAVTEIIAHFTAPAADAKIMTEATMVNSFFSADNVEEIMQSLEKQQTTFGQATSAALQKKSPTSLKVTLRALLRGQTLSFAECMRQEYHLAYHFICSHDFIEGIRALIIDKDQMPHWQPQTLAAVTEEMVQAYFV